MSYEQEKAMINHMEDILSKAQDERSQRKEFVPDPLQRMPNPE